MLQGKKQKLGIYAKWQITKLAKDPIPNIIISSINIFVELAHLREGETVK